MTTDTIDRDMSEHFSPAPRVDIFARQARPGFDAWGNDAPVDDDMANDMLSGNGEREKRHD